MAEEVKKAKAHWSEAASGKFEGLLIEGPFFSRG